MGGEQWYLFLGISYIIQAGLHALGCPYLVAKKYRNWDSRNEYQRGLVLPYALLGIGWTILGILFRKSIIQNIFLYCLYFIVIGMIPYILVVKHEKKYNK